MGSMEAIKAFVKLGQGVGVMPAWVAKHEIDAGILKSVPIVDSDLTRRWGVVYRKSIALGDMEETFLQLVMSSIYNKCLEGYMLSPIDYKIPETEVCLQHSVDSNPPACQI